MSYEPKPSLPRPIHSPVDHYDVDVATGTVTYHVVTTNADRIRAMSDEEMASLFGVWVADCDNNDVPCKEYCSYYKSCGDAWLAWLKAEVRNG